MPNKIRLPDSFPPLLILLAALLAGGLGVFAFAPFYVWPMALVSLAMLFALWQSAISLRQAVLIGFSWGMGLFLAGASWLYVALHVYGNMPAPLAGLCIFLFCCYLSLYPALACLVAYKLRSSASSRSRPMLALLLIMPACFVATEYLRGWVVTGFPWLISGYSQTPGGWLAAPLAGYAPILGALSISWLLALTAGVLVLLIKALAELTVFRGRILALSVSVVLVWAAGAALAHISWSASSGQPLSVALVQGNIDQQLKWREDQRAATLDNYFELAQNATARLIVLPETALPVFLDEIPADYLAALKQRAEKNGGDLIMGVPIAQRGHVNEAAYTYANSAISMGISPPQRYDKVHLVAFGEFIPPLFSWAYNWLNIPLAGFTPGPQTQAPMRVSGHSVAVNICYEDTFGYEIARPLPEAELLVNIANMAWYGHSLAAAQHVQFSQMRALETSRWMLRSTNTGVTAAINEHGEIVKSLPQFVRGVLTVEAIPRQGATPYVRWREGPVLLGLVIALLASWFMRRGGAVRRSKID